jgi:hypothetical protein
MALTFTAVAEGAYVEGNKRIRIYDVTFDDSYPAAGEVVTAANFGLNKIIHIDGGFAQKSDETLAYAIAFDPTVSSLVAYEGDYDNAGDNPFIQVDDTDSLDGYYIRLKVTGR